METKSIWKNKTLRTCTGMGLFAAVAGVVTCGIATIAMPVFVPAIATSYALYGAAAGLLTATGVTSAYKVITHHDIDPLLGAGGLVYGIFATLIGLGVNIGTGLSATAPYDAPIKAALTEVANTNFGKDWRNGQRGQSFELNIALDDKTTFPVTATLDSAAIELYARGAKSSVGQAKLQSQLSFNVSSTLPGKPYATTIWLNKERPLKQSELNWMVPPATLQ